MESKKPTDVALDSWATPLLEGTLLARLEKLNLLPGRARDGQDGGRHRSRRLGSAIELAGHREYSFGDDLRLIDWNAYGRLDRLFLKLREREESIDVHFLLDTSTSMGLGRHNKLRYAQRLTAALAYVALAGRDKVEVIAFSRRLGERFPLTGGRANAHRLFAYLQRLRPHDRTDFSQALRHYLALCPQPGLTVIISDFMSPQAIPYLQWMLERNLSTVAIHLLDETELRPTFWGDWQLVECETGSSLEASVGVMAQEDYRRRFQAWCEELEALCLRYGARYLRAETGWPLERVLFRELRLRRILS